MNEYNDDGNVVHQCINMCRGEIVFRASPIWISIMHTHSNFSILLWD